MGRTETAEDRKDRREAIQMICRLSVAALESPQQLKRDAAIEHVQEHPLLLNFPSNLKQIS